MKATAEMSFLLGLDFLAIKRSTCSASLNISSA